LVIKSFKSLDPAADPDALEMLDPDPDSLEMLDPKRWPETGTNGF
jgi:hypothetical protein